MCNNSTDLIYSLELKNLPIESGFWISELLSLLFESHENDHYLYDKFSQIVKSTAQAKEQSQSNQIVNYLNGLFLIDVKYDKDYIFKNK